MKRIGIFVILLATGCSQSTAATCRPGDQDGVIGVHVTRLVSVNDDTFAVGGLPNADSGLAPQRNITIQNLSTLTLTLTNVGTKPHDLVFHCIPSGLPAGCPATSCFPSSANVPTIAPGESATTRFTTPAVEGPYPFTSDEPGDSVEGANGTFTGLVGEITLE